VNCTAFTPEIIESELFGHIKGSFTGAINDKVGILEKADGGTLFLDEIGDIPLHMQVKLLRFLQFGEIRPVGSNETKNVKIRIIAATNQVLEELIENKLFRQDLYFRLNTFTIELPPLRERKEDIPLYAYHFLKKAMLQLNKKVEKITSESFDQMMDYDWPGNLRELQGVIERAIILTNSNTIEPENLPIFMQSIEPTNYNSGFKSIKRAFLSGFEKNAIRHYLQEAENNVTKAAMLAKLPRKSFYRLMDKYEIKAKNL
jgi:transcriptional regulator with PAS, ATPase and Fis domain